MSFLSRLGRAITKPFRAETYRPRPDSYVTVKESYLIPEWNWNLGTLQAALQATANGDLAAAQRMAHAMMRDPELAHGVETRAETFTQADFCWEKPQDCPQWYFDLWVDCWQSCLSSDDHQQHAQNRLMVGTSPANVTWGPDPSGTIWLPKTHLREPSNLLWRSDPNDRRYYFQGLDQSYPVDSDGQRWLLFSRPGTRPHLAGAVMALAIPWFFKQEAMRGWPTHNRSHVKPERVLKVPANQRESFDVQALVRQAQQLMAGGTLILPQFEKDQPSFGYELVEAKADTFRTFAELIKVCDNYITLYLLGATENTQGSSSSNAKAQTHDLVLLRKVKSDSKSSAASLTILSRKAAELNGLPPRCAPLPKFDADPPEDEDSLAERQLKRSQAFVQVMTGIEKADTHNAAHPDNQIQIEAEYLAEQAGMLLTRAQDGQQSRTL